MSRRDEQAGAPNQLATLLIVVGSVSGVLVLLVGLAFLSAVGGTSHDQKSASAAQPLSVTVDRTLKDYGKLCVMLKLSHSNPSRKFTFDSWANVGTEGVSLTDDIGNSYQEFFGSTRFNGMGGNAYAFETQMHKTVYANEPQFDGLVFEAPVKNAKSLTLELPASHFGGSGVVRLKITSWASSARRPN